MEKNDVLDNSYENIDKYEDNTDDNLEPSKKKMKYSEDIKPDIESVLEPELLLQFKIGYITKSGNILLENKNLIDDEYPEDNNDNILLIGSHKKAFEISILNFQTIEGGEVYLIDNNWTKIGLNKSYTISEIYNNFINGQYFIGTLKYYYKNNYKNGIIDDVTEFYDEANSEIRLHYTQLRSYEGNVAWRTITWDLFAEFVPK